MKTQHILLVACWFGAAAMSPASPNPDVTLSDLRLEGRIDGENVTFLLTFTADARRKGVEIPLVEGNVGYVEDAFPSQSELKRDGKQLILELGKRGKQQVSFTFASLPVEDGDWRQTQFRIPASTIRKLSMVFDREDLEVEFPGALRVEREQGGGGPARVHAFLGVADEFSVRWKPEVRRLDAELVVDCDANVVASASVGALHTDTVFTYRIVQGALQDLTLQIPDGVNVTQVRGNDILRWHIERSEDGTRLLRVELNRSREGTYALQVEADLVLPEFPSKFTLPVLTPLDVIRTSGFLLVGTDSAVKLLVNRAKGLTQIDHDAFQLRDAGPETTRTRPSRTAYTYQFANLPYMLELAADDIVPAFTSDDRLVLSLRDGDLVLEATVELDVRDAPARDVVIETEAGWLVAHVSGANVSDYDIRDAGDQRTISVYFLEGVVGRTLLTVRLERSLDPDASSFDVPKFRVRDAKSERGFLVLSAETGIRFVVASQDGLRDVQTGSLPVRVADARQAFRFKSGSWRLGLTVDTTAPAVYAELFHLVSLGDGALYGSCSVTYNIEGAPIRHLRLSIPESYQHVEFVGSDIRSWRQEGTTWTLSMQEKVFGDYTLLITYDQPFDAVGEDVVLGGIETVDSEYEIGYIATAGASSYYLEGAPTIDDALIPIERTEIPQAYSLLINEPVLQAFKYVRIPHAARLAIRRYPTQELPRKVNDHTTIESRISADGELVTKVSYFVKNTSDQYLDVRLPEGATLWSVQVDGVDTQALDTDGGRTVLVPLPRHADPNEPSLVELTYAEAGDRLGWRNTVQLNAPSCSAQSVFARWSLSVPDDFAVDGIGGNMMREAAPPRIGLRSLVGRVWAAGTAFVRIGPEWILVGFIVLAGACVIAFQIGRQRGILIPGIAMGFMAAASLVVVQRVGTSAGDLIGRVVKALPVVDGFTTSSFTRVVSLADSELALQLRVVPAWVGATGSLFWAVTGLLAGLVVVAAGMRRTVHGAAAATLGIALVIWALTQTLITLQMMVILILAAIPASVFLFALRWSLRAGALHRLRSASTENDPPPLVGPAMQPAGGATDGFVRVRLLLTLSTIATAGFVLAPVMSGAKELAQAGALVDEIQAPAPPREPVHIAIESVDLDIDAPDMENGEQQIARIQARIAFTAEDTDSFLLLPAPHVLTEITLSSKRLRAMNTGEGVRLYVDRKGAYDVSLSYLVEVCEREGAWTLHLSIPECLKNHVTLTLPESGLEVRSPEAVMLRSEPSDAGLVSTIIFGPARAASITWSPQVRRTRLEEAVFFSEMASLATFDAGVVYVNSRVRYQVAQGEIQSLLLDIPNGMSVTRVHAPDLGTWRFDPETHLLEALLSKPVSGEFVLDVTTQVARDGLPYRTELELPTVRGAALQRGSLALAVPDTVQIRSTVQPGLTSMNINDFSHPMLGSDAAQGQTARPVEVKRAFRYHQSPVRVVVDAEQVLPEIRVAESAHLDISDERIALTTRIDATIAKSGVFLLRFGVPEGYDVESLTGEDVSHWDELPGEAFPIVVHFQKQILGTRSLNLVLARTEKGVEETVQVPRVRVQDALKHTGTLLISGERGVRFTTVNRDAVSEINPRDLGVAEEGYLAFRLLRPSWSIELETEVMAPAVKADVLQLIDVSEGMIQIRSFVRYEISNAGVKTLRFQSPYPDVGLSFFGRNIARIRKQDEEQGIWEVDLQKKVEQAFALEVRYQLPFRSGAEEARVLPLRTLETHAQQGFVVVRSGGRLQIRPASVSQGLIDDNARSIPREFGAGDLSDAILCYRSTRPDYEIALSVVRHDSADVLPATVRDVEMTSVVSEDEQLVTRVHLNMVVGSLRFLETELPEDSKLWSVFVQGEPVTPLVEDRTLMIPLEQVSATAEATVELIYGGRAQVRRLGRSHSYTGPRFNLPLSNIQWRFYVPPAYRTYGYGGTMQRRSDTPLPTILSFDARRYEAQAEEEVAQSLRRAEMDLQEGEQFAREGKQREARRAFEAALYNSQGAEDFNEDARIQYRNLARQQAVVGLVNRRDQLKQSRNIFDEEQEQQLRGFQGGNWTVEYGRSIEQSLDKKDTDSLHSVAEKILDQQAAAAGQAPAIRITIPLHGKQLDFFRTLQINPLTEMRVEFRTFPSRRVDALLSVALLVGLWGLLRLGWGCASERRIA